MKLELVRDKATDFPKIDNPEKYSKLKIWHCGYKSLEPIKDFINLEDLEIASLPDNNLDFLHGLDKLKHLRILHLPHITNLEPLGQLAQLEGLILETLPSWDSSGKVTIILSLKPLNYLKRLKKLTLYSVLPADNNFTCLAECINLQELRLQKKRKTIVSELRKLHRIRPDLKGNFLGFI